MPKNIFFTRKHAAWSASLMAAASLAFSPVLFPAFAAKFISKSGVSFSLLDGFTPAGVDSKLAARFKAKPQSSNAISVLDNRFAFTPVGSQSNIRQTLTIAARADSSLSSKAVSTRTVSAVSNLGAENAVVLVKSDFRLRAARGWQDFKIQKVQQDAVKAPMVNLSVAAGNFRLDDKQPAKKNRFDTSVKVKSEASTAPSPRGNTGAGEYSVDVGGSYRLTRGVALTAGVRYKTSRDRIDPINDDSKDSEAVYIGTKVRF
jgi:hypothetical protein